MSSRPFSSRAPVASSSPPHPPAAPGAQVNNITLALFPNLTVSGNFPLLLTLIGVVVILSVAIGYMWQEYGKLKEELEKLRPSIGDTATATTEAPSVSFVVDDQGSSSARSSGRPRTDRKRTRE
ncbi:hypothetical protein H2201_005998 [Coniosporium apollinis]|uniref:Small integral membrane protein 8 n=1 Tax=Coniosporium apollinis TaxID=61459 RepID=A0ABQ9NQM4_9PEZI|nr:hypothetical protein H2201_005998 [Coniosporium apollinis]